MLAEALEHLVRGVVDNPDDVSVRDKELRRGSILEVRVHPDDLGKVIGRGGRTERAHDSRFSTVLSSSARELARRPRASPTRSRARRRRLRAVSSGTPRIAAISGPVRSSQ